MLMFFAGRGFLLLISEKVDLSLLGVFLGALFLKMFQNIMMEKFLLMDDSANLRRIESADFYRVLGVRVIVVDIKDNFSWHILFEPRFAGEIGVKRIRIKLHRDSYPCKP